ncbi:hypothetical protein [Francisella sp. 19X1-34]|uniref:hypothetical protein n=1 Tax=Francisella sp. 19X1-34 TaxID=3087177 RepID=UPI002E32D478|nr:hypothetical protein [Francisella sp. 19X1-34]MED7787589.1 hypothetical protein [Francisella sp. 19X1-34]
MSIVKIIPFNMIGEDERGITSSFKLCRQQDNFIFITRKSGSISGNTFHKGLSDATNPKVFVLLTGKIKFSYRDINSNDIHEKIIEGQNLIEVFPNVTHQVEAITDIIILEANSIQDIANDRERLNVYVDKR